MTWAMRHLCSRKQAGVLTTPHGGNHERGWVGDLAVCLGNLDGNIAGTIALTLLELDLLVGPRVRLLGDRTRRKQGRKTGAAG